MKFLTIVSIFLSACQDVAAQHTFTLQNPSFDQDKPPIAGQTPEGWLNLGASAETAPDIQPGCFETNMKARDGRAYVGMVVRDNNTWEGIGQRLEGQLQKDSAYTFSVWLAHSPMYWSTSRVTGQPANFNAPTVLKIWGVNSISN